MGSTSEPRRFARLGTVLRVLGAVLGGYAVTALAVSGGAGLLARAGMARSEAVVLAALLGFLAYLAVLLWAFSARRRSGAAPAGFRASMTWLHTWAGVVLGSVLFAIFWMGSLSVFDREIDRWMMPATRLAPAKPVSLDRIAAAVAPAIPAGASQWRIDLPTERTPLVRLTWRAGKEEAPARQLDPHTLAFLPAAGTLGATGFIFPFHYRLHLKWLELGKWIVGLAGMAMLALLVSGVVIHRKLFAQFFTFRPWKSLQRASLDLHNLTGVLALPFHFMIALSGLAIFITIYFPQAYRPAYTGETAEAAFTADAYGKYARPKAGAPGTLASLDVMAQEAQRMWGGGRPYFVRVWHPGDANSYAELRRSYAHEVTMNLDQIYFDAASGQVLQRFEAAPVMSAQRFLSGMHFIQFEHWPLRWLYFGAGLSGCVLIATGYLFWLQGRRARHARQGLSGVRVVEGLAVGSVTGIIAATLVLFGANRLLPADAHLAGHTREALEVWAFYLAWIVSFVHGWLRGSAAWREQSLAIAALGVACVLLNWISTGDHPLRALGAGLSAVAGMDLMLLVLSGLAVCAWRRLGATASVKPARARPAVAEAQA